MNINLDYKTGLPYKNQLKYETVLIQSERN
jgi:hypothetical protein